MVMWMDEGWYFSQKRNSILLHAGGLGVTWPVQSVVSRVRCDGPDLRLNNAGTTMKVFSLPGGCWSCACSVDTGVTVELSSQVSPGLVLPVVSWFSSWQPPSLSLTLSLLTMWTLWRQDRTTRPRSDLTNTTYWGKTYLRTINFYGRKTPGWGRVTWEVEFLW